MTSPAALHTPNVYCNTPAVGASGAAAGQNNGLTIVGSSGHPLGSVRFDTAVSTGTTKPSSAAVRSVHRSPRRSATPVGNSPITPSPATVLALPTQVRTSTTTHANDQPATSGRTAPPRNPSIANVVPAASNQVDMGWSGRRSAAASPTA